MFEDDQQVKNFIELKEEFENTQVDQQNMFVETKDNLKLISKRNFMMQLEDKCQATELAINIFMNNIDVLSQKGLPNPLVINERLMRQEYYDKNIREVAKEQSNNSSLKGIPTGKLLYQTFENHFYLQHEVNHLFVNKPSFAKYTEANEI